MIDVKKIDIHAHSTAWPETFMPWHSTNERFPSAEELIAIYDKLNIEKGVLLPLYSAEGQWELMTSQNCKYIADKYPDRFVWFCGVDPRAGRNAENTDLSYLLKFYQNIGARGMGELTAQLYADAPQMDNLFAHCSQCDMPVIIHIAPQFGGGYGIVDDLGLPRLEKMLKKHPQLKLIGHSQPFWSEMSAELTQENRNTYPTGKVIEGRLPKMMRENPNLYCDLSARSGANALMRDPEYAARFVEEFSDRILYGCDFCSANETHQFRFNDFLTQMVEAGYISQENYVKIVRTNALRILKLDS